MDIGKETRYFRPPSTLDDEARLRHQAGSYNYLCRVGGNLIFSHRPIGTVLHVIPRSH